MKKTKYSIPLMELLTRPFIRDDQAYDYLNKLTDEEIEQRYKEVELILEEEGVSKKFPDWNAARLAKLIDSDVLYKVFKSDEKK